MTASAMADEVDIGQNFEVPYGPHIIDVPVQDHIAVEHV